MRFDVFQDLLPIWARANVAGLELPRAHLRHFGASSRTMPTGLFALSRSGP